MCYRDAIERNKLFGQFDKLAEFEEVTKAEVTLLKGLVLDIADMVEPFMDRIGLTFKHYTKHDLQHLLNIAEHIHDFLPHQKKRGQRSSSTQSSSPISGLRFSCTTSACLSLMLTKSRTSSIQKTTNRTADIIATASMSLTKPRQFAGMSDRSLETVDSC